MKKNITCIILIALLGITVSASVAQQNQNVPKTDTEVEKLKIQLQTSENEKMEIETKLAEAKAKHAEAHAKLIDTEFDKLKLELKDFNEKWLLGWIGFFGVIFAVFGVILFSHFKTKVDQMIENGVEKSLTGFQEAFEQVNELKDELGVLKKELAIIVLDNFGPGYPVELELHTEGIKALSDEMLLEIFSDKTSELENRWNAADILIARKDPRLVSPVLTSLNSIVDSDIDRITFHARFRAPHIFWGGFSGIYNKETYQGLKDFLKRLIKEDPKNKDVFLTWTVFLLAQISSELDRGDSVSMIIKTIPDLDVFSHDEDNLNNLVEYFNKFQEHVSIKDILKNGLTDGMPDVETRCLQLLEKHDPDFVNEWKAQKVTANTEREESDESKPTN